MCPDREITPNGRMFTSTTQHAYTSCWSVTTMADGSTTHSFVIPIDGGQRERKRPLAKVGLYARWAVHSHCSQINKPQSSCLENSNIPFFKKKKLHAPAGYSLVWLETSIFFFAARSQIYQNHTHQKKKEANKIMSLRMHI